MANDLLSECIYSVLTIFVKIMTSEFHVTFEYDSKCFIIYMYILDICKVFNIIYLLAGFEGKIRVVRSDHQTSACPSGKTHVDQEPSTFYFLSWNNYKPILYT